MPDTCPCSLGRAYRMAVLHEAVLAERKRERAEKAVRKIHFPESDARFCGQVQRVPFFSHEDALVTCERCLAKTVIATISVNLPKAVRP